MLTAVNPKLPMRDKNITNDFYINNLGFEQVADYADYLILRKDSVEMHFFAFAGLNPDENYGQVYIRTDDIDSFYESLLARNVSIHPAGGLQPKPWGQKEFSMLDPDKNLLTFGQRL
jgi:catechol 2,3-dioxygenase-like lactoylglutathione lyase family enzyme